MSDSSSSVPIGQVMALAPLFLGVPHLFSPSDDASSSDSVGVRSVSVAFRERMTPAAPPFGLTILEARRSCRLFVWLGGQLVCLVREIRNGGVLAVKLPVLPLRRDWPMGRVLVPLDIDP